MKQTTLSIKIFILLILFILPCVSSAAEKPEIFVQMGHTDSVNSVAFSPDGRYALSGSSDKTLKLWEVATGKEIRTFSGHKSSVVSGVFSFDGRYALSGGGSTGFADYYRSDHTIRLWDISSGKEIKTFTGHIGYLYSVALSPDGKYVLSGSSDGTNKLWDIATGKEIKTITVRKDGETYVAFSPDGKYGLSADGDKIMLWEIATGKEIRRFEGNKGFGSKPIFSPDGKNVLSVYFEKLILWDVETGKEIKIFEGHFGYIGSLAFSPNGEYVLSGSWGNKSGSKDQGDDNTVRLWDVSTGKEIMTFAGHTSRINSVAFSPDGKYALSGSRDMTLKLWDIATGNEIRQFTGHTGGTPKVAFSPDGRYVLTSSDKVFNLWDVLVGRGIRTFTGHTDSVNSVAFSPDGRYALSGSGDKTLKLWDVSIGKEIRTFIGHTSWIASVAFSPNGKYALSGSGDNTLRLWDISTGKQTWTVQETKENCPSNVSSKKNSFDAASFSIDGRHILAGYCNCDPKGSMYCESTTIKLFDTLTGREIRTFSPTTAGLTTGAYSITLSPDGRYALTGVMGLWEISNGRLIRIFEKDKPYRASSVAFSPDGMYVISGNYSSDDLNLWDVVTGKEIKTFQGHKSSVGSVTFSPDGKYVFSGSEDVTTRIWDMFTGMEIAQFISFTDGEWIVITPEGYYNSSANGDKHLNVRIGNNVYGIDQYRATYYKPRIVEAALRLGDAQKVVTDVVGEQKVGWAAPTISTIQNIEPPFIVIKSPEDGKKIDSTNAEISLYVEDRNQTIKSVKMYVNGRTVTGEEARGVKITPTDKSPQPPFAKGGINIIEGKKTLDLKIPVHLDSGENLIEVMAFNGFSEGRKSIRIYSGDEKKAAKGEAILPNLWILSIGINKYQDKNLTPLSYAVADAEGIVEAFNSQKGKLFREIKSLIINDNTQIKPTRDNITDNLDYVKKAGHNDIVLLFIAGHGINDEGGDFYFLPSDAVISEDGSIKKSKAISWRDIKAILDIPAKKLIFADTCHSEGVSGKKTRGVDNDRFVKVG